MIRFLTLLISISLTCQARASFEENARRYMSAQEVIQALSVFFILPLQCQKITTGNASLLGLNSAVSGNPVSPSPTQGTVQWISNCIGEALGYAYENDQSTLAWKNLLSADIVEEFERISGSTVAAAMPLKWTLLPEAQRILLIEHMTYAILGSDAVLADFGLITDPAVFRQKMVDWLKSKPDITIKEALKFLSLNLVMRDEFLSY